jgi:hypothetical protein
MSNWNRASTLSAVGQGPFALMIAMVDGYATMSGVREVIGWMLVGGAVVLSAYAVRVLWARRRYGRVVGDPPTLLTVAIGPEAPYGIVNLKARMGGAPTLTAPVSGRACLCWEVMLLVERHAEDGPYLTGLWRTGRVGDVVLSWEQTQHIDSRTKRTSLSGGGQVAVAAGLISFQPRPAAMSMLVHAVRIVAPPDPELLARLGCPAELVEQVGSDPSIFRLAERSLTAGDRLLLIQAPTSPASAFPDPDQPLFAYPPIQPTTGQAITAFGVIVLVFGAALAIAATLVLATT